MMNDENLEEWYNCPICGHEGFLEDMEHDHSKDCLEYLDDIGYTELFMKDFIYSLIGA